MAEKKRRPWIGFVGLVLLLIGLCMAFNSEPNITPGGVVASIGGVILIWALFTGNMKTFG